MINVKNLKKTFGRKAAVNGVSFSVEKGEVLGFLGPNGAGKSTTMRMITGFIPPSEGEVIVGGFNVQEAPIAARRLIGYLPESAPLYTDMTVGGFLNFTAELRGLSGAARRQAVDRAIAQCFLEPVVHQSIETLSKGYRHRTCLAQSILHDPEVLILDEPTDGLDPNQKHEIRTLIHEMGKNKAIIFSTHILEEVEAVCTRVIIIDRGTVVANGTPAELKRRSARAGSVTLRLVGNPAEAELKVRTLPAVREVRAIWDECRLTLEATPRDGAALSRALFDLARREAWQVEELHVDEGRLDEVFRDITLGDKITRKEAA